VHAHSTRNNRTRRTKRPCRLESGDLQVHTAHSGSSTKPYLSELSKGAIVSPSTLLPNDCQEILQIGADAGLKLFSGMANSGTKEEGAGSLEQSGQKRNDPPVSLPRRLRVEPVDQFFSCQVLQLLRLESSILEKVAGSIAKLRAWTVELRAEPWRTTGIFSHTVSSGADPSRSPAHPRLAVKVRDGNLAGMGSSNVPEHPKRMLKIIYETQQRICDVPTSTTLQTLFDPQLFPEGGGLSERTNDTNSGFLRSPANSLSCRAPLMG
jgi:hypothetical protein